MLDIFGIVLRTCHYRIPYWIVYKNAHYKRRTILFLVPLIPHQNKAYNNNICYCHVLDMQWPLASHLAVLLLLLLLCEYFSNII